MPAVTYLENVEASKQKYNHKLPEGKRNLTEEEISILVSNRNSSECTDWKNVWVSNIPGDFIPGLVRDSRFEGFVSLGRIKTARIKYHDLELDTGIVNCLIRDCVIGDDCALRNVSYLENYRIGDRNILFNIQEMSCTKDSHFGNGYLLKGEKEDFRKWIGVANENDGRAILPFESMICSDAYLWSRFPEDKALMKRFVEFTDRQADVSCTVSGVTGRDVVIKNTTTIKDVKIGNCAYIKGAFKLKNITVLSDEDEVSQIGEGVEMVNGIMNAGSHVFYQAVAVRFVIGRNCQLKYGARLLNSFLADNSTVSCCELLNNLIFPFHEQHHNSSFLIASTVMGQSNIAAGATIGSNHNSRSPDGEILAGRGFWPGLCSDFKHNSKFASFVLASKGSYQKELDVQYPFCLLAPGDTPDSPVHILPAWWFMYDMFAIVRNKYKFAKRDKRFVKVQNIEMNPFAPDTMQEVLAAAKRIIRLTANNLTQLDIGQDTLEMSDEERYQAAKDYLHQHPDSKMTLTDIQAQKKYGAIIYKPVQGYKTYRKITKYFISCTIQEYCKVNHLERFDKVSCDELLNKKLYTKWVNAGGQVIPYDKILTLFEEIKARKINSWNEVHAFYAKCQNEYLEDKARYALYLLETLYSRSLDSFTEDVFEDIRDDTIAVAEEMYSSSVSSREKDYTDYYRCMTYKNKDEMTAVIGTLDNNDFLKTLKADTDELVSFVRNAYTVIKNK